MTGPSDNVTPVILDILKKNNVNATFFVLYNGGGENVKNLLKREVSEGNAVAIHGYSHDYSKIYANIDALMDNYYKMENFLKEQGIETKIIRFPGGTSNTVSKKYCEGIMTNAAKRATDEGYIYVDWNVDSDDAGGKRSADEIYNNVTSYLRYSRTNVVLMHDSTSKATTAEALQRIIDYCHQNGYDLQTITPETPINSAKHHPNN